MIKINLLNTKTASSKPRPKRVAVLCGFVISSLALFVLLSWYLLLHSGIKGNTTLLTRLREEKVELDRIAALIAQNRNRQLELESSATSLENSSRTRLAPIAVLDAVTGSLPVEHRLSLTSLSHTEQRVLLSGNSLDFTAITDFVLRLESLVFFDSVELNRWENRRSVFHFEILCVWEE